jgi:ubiquinone/menaquinone biosynthesis C-methylase UbiE
MEMNTIANSPFSGWVAHIMGPILDNRFRRRFFGTDGPLSGADLQPGQTVLEIGCGSGYFTLPAARLLTPLGALIAIDPFAEAIQAVQAQVDRFGLDQVRLLQTDALHTGLPAAAMDRILLFGVIPSPTFSMDTLLSELARLLKPSGSLAVWPPFFWLPTQLTRSGIFSYQGKNQGVLIFSLA